MRGFLERALTKAGYEVIAFANGKDAHDRLQEDEAVHAAADRYRHAADGRHRAGAARGRARPQAQDHVHHRLRRGDPQHQLAGRRKMRACSPSRSTSRTWCARSTACWRPEPFTRSTGAMAPRSRLRAGPDATMGAHAKGRDRHRRAALPRRPGLRDRQEAHAPGPRDRSARTIGGPIVLLGGSAAIRAITELYSSAHPEYMQAARRALDERPSVSTETAERGQARRARSSAVEHYLDMVGVTGSIPVAPTSCRRLLEVVVGKPSLGRH